MSKSTLAILIYVAGLIFGALVLNLWSAETGPKAFIGIIWTAVDKSDNKIDGGDSRSDGTAGELIGNLVPQSVISETILTNADTSIGFKHYGIKPYFTISSLV